MLTLREELAKERFLDLMANTNMSADDSAKVAVIQADILIAALGPKESVIKSMKGCQACFGSGGKQSAPCKICKGTGKVSK